MRCFCCILEWAALLILTARGLQQLFSKEKRIRLIYRGIFRDLQGREPPLEKHEVGRNSREHKNIRKFKQRVAKIGLPISHSCAFRSGSMNLTGVPVIHCYIAHSSKHNGLEHQAIYYATYFCGSGIWSGLSWFSGLFHMVSTKITWWYWDGRWAAMDDPRWLYTPV